MQVNEDLVKQITNAVLEEMKHRTDNTDAKSPAAAPVPSMEGRDRINPVKTSYASYPRAKKGTDPKEFPMSCGSWWFDYPLWGA